MALASALAGLLVRQPLTVDLEILPPQNPRFFEGTAVAREAASVLKSGGPALGAASR